MTRKNNELRKVEIETGYNPYAEGSCLIKFGNTHVLCTATVETTVPPFLRNTGTGWVTAEYGMLPRSTHSRMNRKKSAESGRTQEIQRLIGRSLRAVVDVNKMGENQVRIDCDVIQADGGTRTASITGAWVAMKLAEKYMLENNIVTESFVVDNVSAISCGIVKGECVLDLDYEQDSSGEADANFVLTETGKIVEVQATAEEYSFPREQFNELFELAEKGCAELSKIQQQALK
ncbi:MAG: ribonuclease PH [Alphaproteobacteria bacterium]